MESGEFPADLILFMPGMTGNQWFDNTELARSEGGLLKADKFCICSSFCFNPRIYCTNIINLKLKMI
jgi:hypothetical protein